jgi:hypothetical protein
MRIELLVKDRDRYLQSVWWIRYHAGKPRGGLLEGTNPVLIKTIKEPS